MGKRRHGGKWGGGRALKRSRDVNGQQADPARFSKRTILKENEAFERYYKAQNLVPEAEWTEFMEAFRNDLPVVFRIAGLRSLAEDIGKCLEETYFSEVEKIVIDGNPVEPPKPLPWYPDRVAWQVDLSRKTLRKSEELNYFHKFLVRESEQGNITRQEAVSMIPPLLLDVHPSNNVLDMCAAPGSKTAQIIEMMHTRDGSVPTGVLVANDKDNKRCYMLVHQTKRLNSPSLVVLNEDASCIPNLCYDEKRKVPLAFDRILCDVPCSGDGTFRKNLELWRTWSVVNANGLHKLQARILRRGLEMLAVGGRLVYSTCSLNPIEDEAVVSSLLEQCQGAIELIDCSDSLPDLKRTPGVSTWKVQLKNGTMVSSFDDVPEDLKHSYPASLFPGSKNPELHLDRCWRVLPHHQNTGGFFIVAMRKVATLPWMRATKTEAEVAPETETKTEGEVTPSGDVDAAAGGTDVAKPGPRLKRRGRAFGGAFKEDPFVFFTGEEDPSWIAVKDFFKLGDGIQPHQLLTRSHGGKKRAIYMASSEISKLVPQNEAYVKVVNTGVRVFARSSQAGAACHLRVVQEGLHAILPHINARRFTISPTDALALLKNWSPQLFDLSKELQKALDDVANGSCVLTLPAGPGSAPAEESADATESAPRPLTCPLHFSAWKSRFTLRLLVTLDDRSHFLMLLGQGKVEDIQAQVEAQLKALDSRPKKSGDDVLVEDEEDVSGENLAGAMDTELAEQATTEEAAVEGDEATAEPAMQT